MADAKLTDWAFIATESYREQYAKEIAAGEIEVWVSGDGTIVNVVLLKPITQEQALRNLKRAQRKGEAR